MNFSALISEPNMRPFLEHMVKNFEELIRELHLQWVSPIDFEQKTYAAGTFFDMIRDSRDETDSTESANDLLDIARIILYSYENIGSESDNYLLAIGQLAELMGVETEDLVRPKLLFKRHIDKLNNL